MADTTTSTPSHRAELTDTFGGEPNYSWVHRVDLHLGASATDREVVLAAKEALGLTGVRCQRDTIGEVIRLRPYGTATVAFIEPVY